MIKSDLITAIMGDTGARREDVTRIMESFMRVVRGTMAEKRENIHLRGFGTFLVRHAPAKHARNITAGTTIEVPPRDVPAFKPCKDFVMSFREEPSALSHSPAF